MKGPRVHRDCPQMPKLCESLWHGSGYHAGPFPNSLHFERGPIQLPTLVSQVPNLAIVSYMSSNSQDDIGDYLQAYILRQP